MRKYLVGLFLIAAFAGSAQQRKTENIVVVTLDGMRWQEIFGGVDSAILHNAKYTHEQKEISAKLWNESADTRRKALLPFLWNVVAKNGQLYGNRNEGCNVDNANKYKFSYPGYNEIFTGYPDTGVNSNDKIRNPNKNVLEFIGAQAGFRDRIAAFSTWDVMPYFLNKWRNGIFTNADQDTIAFNNSTASLLNDIQTLSLKPNGERLDVLTYISAREYLKEKHPRVLYIGFDETDEYAHHGTYDYYLAAAHGEDAMLADLWHTLQVMPDYKDKTTLIVTCDHGRGDKIKDQWRDHGQKVEDAGHIWIAAIGPDTKPSGEIRGGTTIYQKQLAATFAALLGFTFHPDQGSADPIVSIYK